MDPGSETVRVMSPITSTYIPEKKKRKTLRLSNQKQDQRVDADKN